MTQSQYDYSHYMIVSISKQFINNVTDNDDFVTKFVVTTLRSPNRRYHRYTEKFDDKKGMLYDS